ncbi:MAG: ABC transporter ATP-binding protein/permease [Bacteroidales bacterium]|jgi:ATP-binding cassette subfamily B protein|nr:ABC transporter ATP-binding protein/permease [Bacteroidales bacterium]
MWNASKGIRGRLCINGLLGLIGVAAGLAFIYYSKVLIDLATQDKSVSNKTLYLYGAVLVVLILLEIFTDIYSSWLGRQTEIKMKNRTRRSIFGHLMNSSWDGDEKFHSGDMLNRLEEDVRVITDTLCNSFTSAIVTIVQLIAAFVFLAMMSPKLAITILLIMPLFLIFSKFYVKRMRRMTSDIRSTDSKVQSILQESLQHKIVIQSMEQSGKMGQNLEGEQDTLYGQTMKRTRFSLSAKSLVALGFVAGYMVAFLWGIINLHEGAITFGIMAAFLQLVGQIQRPTVDLARQIPVFVSASTSIDRLAELEAVPEEESKVSERLKGIAGVRMNNVSFRYSDGDRFIFKNFSHDFVPGSRTAVVGETGAGKSTMIRLMLSLLHPQEGEIILYNRDGDSIKSDVSGRCNFVYVPQGNSLLSGTIRDNLLLGDSEATDQQMYAALHESAADFVKELPQGLDSRCGELGAGLSEGQAQRVAIARGLLRKGSIMLLDEFSSSLDAETEKTLIQRLLDNQRNKTMIFITHRDLILQYCSNVVKITP